MVVFLGVANWLLPLLYLALLMEYGAVLLLRAQARGRGVRLPPVIAFHVLVLVLMGLHQRRAFPVNNFEVLSVLAVVLALLVASIVLS